MVTNTAVMAFHCATPNLSQLEDHIVHACHYGRGLTLVIGAPGSGRTHLSRRLTQTLSNQLSVALIEAHPMLSSEQLDRAALEQLGLTQLALQNKTLTMAIEELPPGRRVLVVDDAQDLSLHVLKDLMDTLASEWEREDPRLCAVFIGDEMLEAALAELDLSAAMKSEIFHQSLPAFSLDDMRRLASVWAASVASDVPSEENIKLAWQQSYGRPGAFLQRITSLEGAMSEINDEEPMTADVMEHHPAPQYSLAVKYGWLKLPAIFLGVFLLALILLYQNEFNSWISTSEPEAATANVESTQPRQTVDIAPTDVDTEVADTNTISIVEEPTPAETDSIVNPTEQLESTEVVSAQVVAEDLKTKTVVSQPAPVVKPIEALSQSQSSGQANADFTADEQTLLAAKSAHFAVQIIGLVDDKAMMAYMARQPLKNAFRYRSVRNGKPWQILVLAPFESRAKADAARNALPESIRKQGPWIKSLQVIQNEIRAAEKLR